MAMERRRAVVQREFRIPTDTPLKAPGHLFHEQLNEVLAEASFDGLCESAREKSYAAKLGRPSDQGQHHVTMLRPQVHSVGFRTGAKAILVHWAGTVIFMHCRPRADRAGSAQTPRS